MAIQGISGMAVAATVGGWILLYSGLRGAKVSDTLRSLVGGQKPTGAQVNPVTASFDTPAAGGTSSGSSSGTAAAPTNASEKAFISALLSTLSAPDNAANQNSLAAWFRHEFGSWPPRAANNPMATTQPEPGATTYNPIGVKNYPDSLTGVKATAATLNNGLYPTIIANLRAGKGICGGGMAGEFSKWSGGGYSSVC